MHTEKPGNILKNVRLSAAISPLRVGLPMLAYLFLYPIIIARSGIKVLGLWSIIATLSTYMSLADVGFSSLFIRSVSSVRSAKEFSLIAREHTSARRFYWLITFLMLLVWAGTGQVIISKMGGASIYPPTALFVAVATYIAGTGVSITAQLDAAIINGAHKTYTIQIIDSFSPIILYGVAIFGAVLSKPIEGFAMGSLLAALYQIIAYRFQLNRTLPGWQKNVSKPSFFETIHICRGLMRRGINFYTISLAFILREPIFRIAIASTIGFTAAGTYEIASRIPAAIRQFFVAGSLSLFPSFSYYHKHKLIPEMFDLIRDFLMIFVAFAGMALLTYAICADDIFELWLPYVPHNLVISTRIMTLFWGMTILNIPFWYLLQAIGQEKVAARSLLYHTCATLLIFPLAAFLNFSLQAILWYWLFSAIITQISIYYAAQYTLGALVPTLFSRSFLILIIKFLTITILLAALSPTLYMYGLAGWTKIFIVTVFVVLSFFIFMAPQVFSIIKRVWLYDRMPNRNSLPESE
jgi:O-antigen/teichoic acid export membrane protein